MAFSDLKPSLDKLIHLKVVFILCLMITLGCSPAGKDGDKKVTDSEFIEISRAEYANQLYGFWLGQSIANWTGLVTEMDKIGNIGEIKTGGFIREKIGESPINRAFGVKEFPVIFLPLLISCYVALKRCGDPTTIPTSNTCTNI